MGVIANAKLGENPVLIGAADICSMVVDFDV